MINEPAVSASAAPEGRKAWTLRALVSLSTNWTDKNKLNKPEQKIKLSFFFFFTLQGSRKVILRDCNLPTATTLHRWIFHPASPAQLLSLHMVQIKCVMSSTGMLIWCLGVKWSNVSIYTIRLIYEPIIVTEALLFTSGLSLKFIAHLKCVTLNVRL